MSSDVIHYYLIFWQTGDIQRAVSSGRVTKEPVGELADCSSVITALAVRSPTSSHCAVPLIGGEQEPQLEPE